MFKIILTRKFSVYIYLLVKLKLQALVVVVNFRFFFEKFRIDLVFLFLMTYYCTMLIWYYYTQNMHIAIYARKDQCFVVDNLCCIYIHMYILRKTLNKICYNKSIPPFKILTSATILKQLRVGFHDRIHSTQICLPVLQRNCFFGLTFSRRLDHSVYRRKTHVDQYMQHLTTTHSRRNPSSTHY